MKLSREYMDTCQQLDLTVSSDRIQALYKDRQRLQDYIAQSVLISGLSEDRIKLTLGDIERLQTYVQYAIDAYTQNYTRTSSNSSSQFVQNGQILLSKIDILLKENSHD